MSLAKAIWEMQLGIMKSQLKLMEFKFGGRDSEQFRYIKEQIMNYTYESAKKFFNQMIDEKVFERCACGANMRHGWTDCSSCAGSGYSDLPKKE